MLRNHILIFMQYLNHMSFEMKSNLLEHYNFNPLLPGPGARGRDEYGRHVEDVLKQPVSSMAGATTVGCAPPSMTLELAKAHRH